MVGGGHAGGGDIKEKPNKIAKHHEGDPKVWEGRTTKKVMT